MKEIAKLSIVILLVVSLHASGDELWKCTDKSGNVTVNNDLLIMYSDPSGDCELISRSEVVPKRMNLVCRGTVRVSYDGTSLPERRSTETYSFENGSVKYATCSWKGEHISCVYKGTRQSLIFDRVSGVVDAFDSGVTPVGYRHRHFAGQCEKAVGSKF